MITLSKADWDKLLEHMNMYPEDVHSEFVSHRGPFIVHKNNNVPYKLQVKNSFVTISLVTSSTNEHSYHYCLKMDCSKFQVYYYKDRWRLSYLHYQDNDSASFNIDIDYCPFCGETLYA